MFRGIKPEFLITPALLCIFSCLNGQVHYNEADSIPEKLRIFCASHPWEEIYVHTDREDYVSGEILWFNIYLVDRQSGLPSNRSKIAYIELLNPEQNPVVRRRIKVDDGFGPGQFSIPDSLRSGIYTIRAYTNWMKNFLPHNCFKNQINIYNPLVTNALNNKVAYRKSFDNKINLEFYPEGGSMIYGFSCLVGVKAFDEFGRGLSFSANVTDEKGDSVTHMSTDISGLGSFNITPEKGHSYKVDSETYPGSHSIFLPAGHESGITMNACTGKKDTLELVILSDGKFRNENNDKVKILIQTHGKIDLFEQMKLTGDMSITEIPGTMLSPGVNHITLFDSENDPRCERMIFSAESRKLLPPIISPETFKIREKISLAIDLKGVPFTDTSRSNLSIAVYPVAQKNSNIDIGEYLLFGTEFGSLPFRISEATPEMVDNFLLTTKSKWINWDIVFSAQRPIQKNNFEETGYYLKGRLNDNLGAGSNSHKLIFLSSPGKKAVFQYARTDTLGNFVFMVQFEGLGDNLIIQPEEEVVKNTITIESAFPVDYLQSSSSPVPVQVTPYLSDLIVNYQIGKLFSCQPTGESDTGSLQKAESHSFYRKPDFVLLLTDYITLPVMEEVFFELLPGVRMKPERSGYNISITNPATSLTYEKPTLMIDGVIIYDPKLIARLNPESVEKIEVIYEEYIVGDFIFPGLLNVITKTGDFSSAAMPEYFVSLPSRAFDPSLSFYSPEYSSEAKKQSRTPDFRNTLYWKPNIKPDKSGNAFLEFWSSDYSTDYKVNIQGITSSGEKISLKKIIKVR